MLTPPPHLTAMLERSLQYNIVKMYNTLHTLKSVDTVALIENLKFCCWKAINYKTDDDRIWESL